VAEEATTSRQAPETATAGSPPLLSRRAAADSAASLSLPSLPQSARRSTITRRAGPRLAWRVPDHAGDRGGPGCTRARAVRWSWVWMVSRSSRNVRWRSSASAWSGHHVKKDGEWRILSGAWQRTTRNNYHAGWVHSMEPTKTRPPLTPVQERTSWVNPGLKSVAACHLLVPRDRRESRRPSTIGGCHSCFSLEISRTRRYRPG
jgi:hypothetical protein